MPLQTNTPLLPLLSAVQGKPNFSHRSNTGRVDQARLGRSTLLMWRYFFLHKKAFGLLPRCFRIQADLLLIDSDLGPMLLNRSIFRTISLHARRLHTFNAQILTISVSVIRIENANPADRSREVQKSTTLGLIYGSTVLKQNQSYPCLTLFSNIFYNPSAPFRRNNYHLPDDFMCTSASHVGIWIPWRIRQGHMSDNHFQQPGSFSSQQCIPFKSSGRFSPSLV